MTGGDVDAAEVVDAAMDADVSELRRVGGILVLRLRGLAVIVGPGRHAGDAAARLVGDLGMRWRGGSLLRDGFKRSPPKIAAGNVMVLSDDGDAAVTARDRRGRRRWIRLAREVIREFSRRVGGGETRIVLRGPIQDALNGIVVGTFERDGRIFSALRVRRKLGDYSLTVGGRYSCVVSKSGVGELVGADESLRATLRKMGLQVGVGDAISAIDLADAAGTAFYSATVGGVRESRNLAFFVRDGETLLLTLGIDAPGAAALRFPVSSGRALNSVVRRCLRRGEVIMRGYREIRENARFPYGGVGKKARTSEFAPGDVIGGRIVARYIASLVGEGYAPSTMGTLDVYPDSGIPFSVPLSASFVAMIEAEESADSEPAAIGVVDRTSLPLTALDGSPRLAFFGSELRFGDARLRRAHGSDAISFDPTFGGAATVAWSGGCGVEVLLFSRDVDVGGDYVDLVASDVYYWLRAAADAVLAAAMRGSVAVGREAIVAIRRVGEVYLAVGAWLDRKWLGGRPRRRIDFAASPLPALAVAKLMSLDEKLIPPASALIEAGVLGEDVYSVAVEVSAYLAELFGG